MKIFLVGTMFLFGLINLYSENRVALLIANGTYQNFSSLSGPTTEAEALSITLNNLGFDVKLLENSTREQMLDALDNLKNQINGKGGIAFFHYGGHAVQVNGSNYLIPVDADIPDEKKVAIRAVDIDEVMSSLDLCGSDTNIIVLDACRNNPLPAGAGRSASRGLSVIASKPRNSIIVYSAEAGSIAQDGLFTPTLTDVLTRPGLNISDVLLEVRKEVYQQSSGAQIPGEYNQLFTNVILNKIDNQNNILPKYTNKIIEPSLSIIANEIVSGPLDFKNFKLTNTKYTIGRTGIKNGALHFNGKGYAEIDEIIPNKSDSFSLSLWINLDKLNTEGSTPFISNWFTFIDGNQKGYLLRACKFKSDEMPGIEFLACDGKIYYNARYSLPLDRFVKKFVGKWNLITVSFTKGDNGIKLYINGELSAVGNAPKYLIIDQDNGVWIGRTKINENYLYGSIEEIRYFNTAISDIEVMKIYN